MSILIPLNINNKICYVIEKLKIFCLTVELFNSYVQFLVNKKFIVKEVVSSLCRDLAKKNKIYGVFPYFLYRSILQEFEKTLINLFGPMLKSTIANVKRYKSLYVNEGIRVNNNHLSKNEDFWCIVERKINILYNSLHLLKDAIKMIFKEGNMYRIITDFNQVFRNLINIFAAMLMSKSFHTKLYTFITIKELLGVKIFQLSHNWCVRYFTVYRTGNDVEIYTFSFSTYLNMICKKHATCFKKHIYPVMKEFDEILNILIKPFTFMSISNLFQNKISSFITINNFLGVKIFQRYQNSRFWSMIVHRTGNVVRTLNTFPISFSVNVKDKDMNEIILKKKLTIS